MFVVLINFMLLVTVYKDADGNIEEEEYSDVVHIIERIIHFTIFLLNLTVVLCCCWERYPSTNFTEAEEADVQKDLLKVFLDPKRSPSDYVSSLVDTEGDEAAKSSSIFGLLIRTFSDFENFYQLAFLLIATLGYVVSKWFYCILLLDIVKKSSEL